MSPHERRPGPALSRLVLRPPFLRAGSCSARLSPFRRLTVLALCAAAAGCGQRAIETEPAPPRATEAMVRVVNRTASGVRVDADGRPLGEVPAGGEHFFVGIVPGTIDLRGESLDGQLTFRRDLLTLEAGETFTWILREGEGGATGESAGANAPAAAGKATVVVVNTTDWDVQVLLDGQLLGTTSAGRTGRYVGVAPGSHRLEAIAPETSFPQEFPVLEPGETFTWRLRGPGAVAAPGLLPAPGTGRLRVENPNAEPVRVLVNGVYLGVVESRNVRIFENLSPASVRLSGESEDRSTRYEGPAARIEPGRVTTWRMDAGRPGDVAARDAPSGAGVQPGDAGDTKGEPGLSEERPYPDRAPIDLDEEVGGPSDEVSGAVTSAPKVFVVQNHTTQDLQVFFDGEAAGVVGAGMTERFLDLPGTRFTPTAKSASGARGFRHPEVDLAGRDSFTWIITP